LSRSFVAMLLFQPLTDRQVSLQSACPSVDVFRAAWPQCGERRCQNYAKRGVQAKARKVVWGACPLCTGRGLGRENLVFSVEMTRCGACLHADASVCNICHFFSLYSAYKNRLPSSPPRWLRPWLASDLLVASDVFDGKSLN